MLKIAKRFIPLLLLPLLAACASKMTTEVTRFHQLAAPAGQSINVQPMNPAYQNSIEFNQYADLIGDRMSALGYQPPVSGKSSDLMVRIDYGVNKFGNALRDDDNPVSVGVGVGGGSRGSSVGVGISTAFGSSGNDSARFMRWLRVEIDRTSDGVRVFEGNARSEGKTGDLSLVMPYLMDAMFKEFPGKSGATIKVTVDAPE